MPIYDYKIEAESYPKPCAEHPQIGIVKITRGDGLRWLRIEDYDAAIKRIVDTAPPLTDVQRDKLATLLNDDQ